MRWFCVFLLFHYFVVGVPMDTDSKISKLSRKEWDAYFKSDASFWYDSEEALQLAMKSLSKRLRDDLPMLHAIRTAANRDSVTTDELEAVLSGGHYQFVGKSNFYVAFLTRDQVLRLVKSSTFDIVAPVPPLLKLAASRGGNNAGGVHDLFVTVNDGAHVDTSSLSGRCNSYLGAFKEEYQPASVFKKTGTSDPDMFSFDAAKGSQVIRMGDSLSEEKFHTICHWLADQTEFGFIAPMFQIHPSNDEASWVTQTNVKNHRLLWDKGLTGEGQVVGFSDTGIDMAHCMFRHSDSSNGRKEPGVCNPWDRRYGDSRCRKVIQYDTMVDDWDDERDGHGTHVGGSIAGRDVTGGTSHSGMAPDAKLAFMDLGSEPDGNGDVLLYAPGTALGLLGPPYDAGARVYSASWGVRTNTYDNLAVVFDSFLFDNQDMIALVSMGNDGQGGAGTIGSPAIAKNVISVGATMNEDDGSVNSLAYFSSLGPTADGRLKPDVVAPGMFVDSAASTSTIGSSTGGGLKSCGNVHMAGTSMSTPIVAGLAALVRQYFTDGYYPSGLAVEEDGFTPLGALVKAVIVLGGQPLTTMASYPNHRQGYGRVQMDRALYFTEGSQASIYVVGDFDNQVKLWSGDEAVYTLDVDGGSEDVQFRAVLAWSDAPSSVGSASANGALINDLDLEVTVDGETYYPDYSPSEPDRDNNLEVITIPGPSEDTTFTVRVRARQNAISSSGGQPFALAVSARISGSSYSLVSLPREDDDESSSFLGLGISEGDITPVSIGAVGVGALILLYVIVAMCRRHCGGSSTQQSQSPPGQAQSQGTGRVQVVDPQNLESAPPVIIDQQAQQLELYRQQQLARQQQQQGGVVSLQPNPYHVPP